MATANLRALESFSGFLLALYRSARELPAENFQAAALELLKPGLEFDSGMWGTGSVSDAGLAVHSIHLHEQPAAMVENWQEVNSEDTIVFACARNPGRTVRAHMPTLFGAADKSGIRDHTVRFEIGNGLITSGVFPSSPGLVYWLSLFRRDANRQFSRDERRLCQLVMPHITQALTINRLANLDHLFAQHTENRAPVAIVDRKGVVYTDEPGFDTMLRREWPQWRGPTLPEQLNATLWTSRSHAIRGRAIMVRSRIVGDLAYLSVRPLTAVDRLSVREREIAERFAQGLTHKEIARALGISPATVRNHIQIVYAKLAVSNKAEMAQLVWAQPR